MPHTAHTVQRRWWPRWIRYHNNEGDDEDGEDEMRMTAKIFMCLIKIVSLTRDTK